MRDGGIILQIDNGAKVAAEVVSSYPLRLLSDIRLDLKGCYYVLVASRNLIFMSMLAQKGFEISFNKNFYSIYLRNKLIARGLLIDNLYHLHIDTKVNLNE